MWNQRTRECFGSIRAIFSDQILQIPAHFMGVWIELKRSDFPDYQIHYDYVLITALPVSSWFNNIQYSKEEIRNLDI